MTILSKSQINKITSFYTVKIDDHFVVTINRNRLFVPFSQQDYTIWLTFGAVYDLPPKRSNETHDDFIVRRDKTIAPILGAIRVSVNDLRSSVFPEKTEAYNAYRKEHQRKCDAMDQADKMCCRAFGVVEYAVSTSMDNNADELAKKYGLKLSDDANVGLADGCHAYTVVVGQSIDDYEVLVIKTKGSRDRSSLIDFYRTKMDLLAILMRHNYDLKTAKMTCWETGLDTTFYNIAVDANNAWSALQQRVDYFTDSYSGN